MFIGTDGWMKELNITFTALRLDNSDEVNGQDQTSVFIYLYILYR